MRSVQQALADLIPSSATLSSAEVLEVRASSLQRLATLLRLARGAWALAVYESGDVQRLMVEELRAAVAPIPVIEISLVRETPDPLRIVRRIDPNGDAPVVSFDAVGYQLDDLAGFLDLQRDLLATYPHRLVFWVTERDHRQLAQKAPNFYSRLSGVFYFPGSARLTHDGPATSTSPRSAAPSLDGRATGSRRRPYLPLRDERQRSQQIEFLRQRIKELAGLPRPNYAAIGDAWYDLAGVYETSLPRLWLEAEAAYSEAARSYAQAGNTLAEADARFQAGDAARRGYNHQAALLHLNAALRLYRLLAHTPSSTPDAVLGEANVLRAQGDVLAFLDQRAEALAKYEEALGLYRAVGDRLGEANVLKAQGDVLRSQGQYDAAHDRYQTALMLYRATGARQGQANVYLGLGRLALAQGQPEAARSWTEQAIALHAANQSRYDVALDCETLAKACEAAGDAEGAASAWRRAVDNYREINLIDRAASALTSLGDTLANAGRRKDALPVYAEAVALLPDQAWLRRNFADSLIKLGQLDEAASQLDVAEAIEPDAPYLALRRAELAKARQDPATAQHWASEALRRQPEWDEAQAILAWAQAEPPSGA